LDIALIEFLLWIGFGVLLWAIRESMNSVELELKGPPPPPPSPSLRKPLLRASKPQQLIEPIGRYKDRPIHEYAIIEGQTYRFDHICTQLLASDTAPNQRWVAPGLVYVPCTAAPELKASH
jgi:hypothetical protein